MSRRFREKSFLIFIPDYYIHTQILYLPQDAANGHGWRAMLSKSIFNSIFKFQSLGRILKSEAILRPDFDKCNWSFLGELSHWKIRNNLLFEQWWSIILWTWDVFLFHLERTRIQRMLLLIARIVTVADNWKCFFGIISWQKTSFMPKSCILGQKNFHLLSKHTTSNLH